MGAKNEPAPYGGAAGQYLCTYVCVIRRDDCTNLRGSVGERPVCAVARADLSRCCGDRRPALVRTFAMCSSQKADVSEVV
jgi:hypothetical protein